MPRGDAFACGSGVCGDASERRWQMIGYLWALPNTLIGVLLAVLYWPRWIRVTRAGGVWAVEATARRRLLGGRWVAAQTHGWLIYYRDPSARSRPENVAHERAHVRQALRWGPVFWLLYVGHWAWLRGVRRLSAGEAYRAIWAEVDARRAELGDGGGGAAG